MTLGDMREEAAHRRTLVTHAEYLRRTTPLNSSLLVRAAHSLSFLCVCVCVLELVFVSRAMYINFSFVRCRIHHIANPWISCSPVSSRCSTRTTLGDGQTAEWNRSYMIRRFLLLNAIV